MTAKKVAKKKVAAPAVEETEELAPVNAKHVDLTKEDKKKASQLKAMGVELDGSEDSDRLDALLDAHAPTEPEDADEEDEDCPDKVAPRFEIVKVDNRDRKFPIHFVFMNNGKSALYNERGQRISPVYGNEDMANDGSNKKGIAAIAKAAADNNAKRRAAMRPSDFMPA